jgi:hypothetical protein
MYKKNFAKTFWRKRRRIELAPGQWTWRRTFAPRPARSTCRRSRRSGFWGPRAATHSTLEPETLARKTEAFFSLAQMQCLYQFIPGVDFSYIFPEKWIFRGKKCTRNWHLGMQFHFWVWNIILGCEMALFKYILVGGKFLGSAFGWQSSTNRDWLRCQLHGAKKIWIKSIKAWQSWLYT